MLVCASMLFSGTGVAALAKTSVSVTNPFQTGIVDIHISEYQTDGITETLWEDNPTILPGDTISKIPRIYNDGNDAWIRAKVTFRDIEEIGENNLGGISDDWIRAADGYYYYTKIVKSGESVDLFKTVNIPSDFSQDYELSKFYIDINADSVQSKNFKPAFDSSSPWGNLSIQLNKKNNYDLSELDQGNNKNLEISYQGKSKKLFKNEDDFFTNFTYFMPGDEYSDVAELVNNSNTDIDLYFRNEIVDDSPLLDKIQLQITKEINHEQVVIYQGNLKAETICDDDLLGTIKANSSGKFRFKIFVPPELDNDYTWLKSKVKWIFSTEPIKSSKVAGRVQTGDYDIGIILLAIGILLGVSAYIYYKKEDDDEEDNVAVKIPNLYH